MLHILTLLTLSIVFFGIFMSLHSCHLFPAPASLSYSASYLPRAFLYQW